MNKIKNLCLKVEQLCAQRPLLVCAIALLTLLLLSSITTGICLAHQSSKVADSIKVLKISTKLREAHFKEMALESSQVGDSLSHQLVIEMQTSYENRLNNVLADLRQAHSDAITSLGLHFNIWICLLGLIGAVLPLCLNIIIQRRIDHHIKAKERESKRLLEYAALRSEEERFYIVIQNIRALANLGRVYFIQDIHGQINDMFDKLIESNEKIILQCDSEPVLEEEKYKIERKKHEPDILLYSVSLLSLVQQLQIMYSSRMQLYALDRIHELANEMKYETDIEKWCKLIKELNGYLTVLKKK